MSVSNAWCNIRQGPLTSQGTRTVASAANDDSGIGDNNVVADESWLFVATSSPPAISWA